MCPGKHGHRKDFAQVTVGRVYASCCINVSKILAKRQSEDVAPEIETTVAENAQKDEVNRSQFQKLLEQAYPIRWHF